MESHLWADLVAVDPLQAVEFSGEIDPFRIDAELKNLTAMRNRWDEVFGHVALIFKRCGAWDPLDFASFAHYCEERLGMARRTVMQRVALERFLLRMPLLRQALRDGQVSYEKARLIARHMEAGHACELRPLIAMAQAMTCVDLREALTAEAEGQMCARGIFTITAPPGVFDLLRETLSMARALAGQAIALGKCLVELAEHFVAVWKAHIKLRRTKRMRIFGRDRYRCQVPGCSRPAMHLHHIEYRSHGASDDEENLLCLCTAHHLFGIHQERMRVSGTAPDKLIWEFGLRRSWALTAVL
ncbi:MAG TPA: HNH endonuclease signature motif containing protein [Myxococcales bacterium]|nr:HNH endonuclease signature motif containing protein [Myxococcales bacterium]